MAKKKTTYNVTIDYKYKTRYSSDGLQREIKAENEDEAKQIFLAELATSNPTLNLLLSIDEGIEVKVLSAIQCDNMTAFLAKQTAAAQNLLGELKTALVAIKDISPELLTRFNNDYRSLRSYSYSGKDETLITILKQCEILLESVERCAKLSKP